MIQFNLLPDVKIAYIKAQRQKRLVVSISIIASAAALTVLFLLFTFVNVAQRKNMSDLTKDIKSQSQDLLETKDLNKILTVQNQVGALDVLHNDKVVASRLFEYIQQVTPAEASVAQLDIDYTQHTMSISGSTQSLAAVNTYADSLKFTKYVIEGESEPEEKAAFSNVVLSSFTRGEGTARYTINLSYDEVIFSQEKAVHLKVPQIVSNRSNVERPSALFQQNVAGEGQ